MSFDILTAADQRRIRQFLSPVSVIRLSATARGMVSPERLRALGLLKRALRRRYSRRTGFVNSPIGRRLASPLLDARNEARRRARMSLEGRRQAKRNALRQSAMRAWYEYTIHPSQNHWNTFRRRHFKAWGESITSVSQARREYAAYG